MPGLAGLAGLAYTLCPSVPHMGARKAIFNSHSYLTNLLGITLSCILASLILGYTPLHRARQALFERGDKMQQQSDNCTYLYRNSKQSLMERELLIGE